MVAGLAIVAAACGSSGSSNKNSNASQTTAGGTKQGGVFRLGIVEPTAIDPYNSQESEGENVTKAVFEGLVTVDNATAEIKPGVAQSWTKNDACTVWNFKLFPGTEFSPVPKTAGAAEAHSAYADMPIGNGPFKMKEPWQHDKSITLVRNDLYHGTKASLDEVDYTILPSQNANELEYKNFQAGQADFARMPPELIPQAQAT